MDPNLLTRTGARKSKAVVLGDPKAGELTADLVLDENRLERTKRLQADPHTMDIITAYVTNGGSLINLCVTWDVRYCDMVAWIDNDLNLKMRYDQTLQHRDEWLIESIIRELKDISLSDIRHAVDPDTGAVLPPEKWPPGFAKCVEAIQVEESAVGEGEDRKVNGRTVKIKLWNKIKAIELLGKHLHMYMDKIEVSGSVSLEDLILNHAKPTIVGSSSNDSEP